MSYLFAALSIGFLGSFHCIGMCGPIALALPVGAGGTTKRILGNLLYNVGRTLTYGAFGLFFGLVGKGFVVSGYQQALSIALGVIILLGILIPTVSSYSFSLTKIIAPFVSKLKSSLRSLFSKKSMSALFFIGLLNGLLPCGLVYLAVAGSIATGDVLSGGMFMLMFGLGTLPAMLVISSARSFISIEWRNNMRRVVPVFVAAMATILILRGMNLNIPYVSPELSKTDCTKQSCCQHKK